MNKVPELALLSLIVNYTIYSIQIPKRKEEKIKGKKEMKGIKTFI